MTRYWWAFAAVATLVAAGCGSKLNTEKTFALPAEGGDRSALFNLPKHSSEQTVTAAVTSDAAVDVYVFAAKDVSEPRDLTPEERGKKAVLTKTGVTQETIAIKVPAKEEYLVLVALPRNAMKASGKVKFTN
jgi:hypothetical protein